MILNRCILKSSLLSQNPFGSAQDNARLFRFPRGPISSRLLALVIVAFGRFLRSISLIAFRYSCVIDLLSCFPTSRAIDATVYRRRSVIIGLGVLAAFASWRYR